MKKTTIGSKTGGSKTGGCKNSRHAASTENLLSCDGSQRRASTPTHDYTSRTVSPDISCILKPDAVSKQKTTDETIKKTVLFKKPSNVATKEDLDDTLDFEYSRYLQRVFRNKLEERKSSAIDEGLANLQKRIEGNQIILQKTMERLKNVNFNKEVDILHSLTNPNYGKILETYDENSCEEYMSSLHEKLELSQNQLKMKNIEMPEGGAAQLLGAITETVTALEKLKKDHDIETYNVLAEVNKSNSCIRNEIARCTENVSRAEELLLTKNVMELCDKK